MTIADDLAEIASIGPFFDVTTHENHPLCLAATAAPVDLSVIRRNGSTAPVRAGPHHRGHHAGHLLAIASQTPPVSSACMKAFVPTHRCGAVPDSHRIPCCLTHLDPGDGGSGG